MNRRQRPTPGVLVQDWRLTPEELAAKQKAEFVAYDRETERLVRGMKERQAAAEAEQAAAEEEWRAREAAALEGKLKADYLNVPGTTESDWQRDRSAVLQQYRITAALGGGAKPAAPTGPVEVTLANGERRIYRVGKRF